jgi:hypothetical protein
MIMGAIYFYGSAFIYMQKIKVNNTAQYNCSLSLSLRATEFNLCAQNPDFSEAINLAARALLQLPKRAPGY